jgi:hypothetical protein
VSGEQKDNAQEQLEIAERLQLKLLQRFEALIDQGEMSSTDAATLTRLLAANGWNLDPKKIPQRLRDKLTKVVEFDDDLEELEVE